MSISNILHANSYHIYGGLLIISKLQEMKKELQELQEINLNYKKLI